MIFARAETVASMERSAIEEHPSNAVDEPGLRFAPSGLRALFLWLLAVTHSRAKASP